MTGVSFDALLRDAIRGRGADHPVWRYNGKVQGRRLAERLGVRVPRLLGGPGSLERLAPLPGDPFVLKPVQGCSSRGVFPLVAHDDDRYVNLFTGRVMSWRQVKAAAYEAKRDSLRHPDHVTHPWILEEMVGGSVPVDWKFYVIGGRVQLVRERHQGGIVAAGRKPYRAWTRDWRDAGPVWTTGVCDRSMPGPRHPEALVETAELVARHIDSPFVRVDLYEDEQGPVFGEITPHPAGGRLRFVPEWDQRLGQAWVEAER